MPEDREQIRVPELPVFKRFSLAVRQEFADARELLVMLERSVTRIGEILEKRDREQRRAEAAALAEQEELNRREALERAEAELEVVLPEPAEAAYVMDGGSRDSAETLPTQGESKAKSTSRKRMQRQKARKPSIVVIPERSPRARRAGAAIRESKPKSKSRAAARKPKSKSRAAARKPKSKSRAAARKPKSKSRAAARKPKSKRKR